MLSTRYNRRGEGGGILRGTTIIMMHNRRKLLEKILAQLQALNRASQKGGKAATAASLVAVFYLTVVFRQGRRPEVTCRRNSHNTRVLRALGEVIERPYFPSWLTPNAHVNCLLGFVKRGPRMGKTRELIRAWGERNWLF